MRVVIKKWGNSASVRIPATLMEMMQLELDDEVELYEDDGRIIIEPLRPTYNLQQLLSKITAKNLHKTVDFGEPMGEETF